MAEGVAEPGGVGEEAGASARKAKRAKKANQVMKNSEWELVQRLQRDPQRFWKFVTKSEGCWEWHGSIWGGGYGNYCGRVAHRLSWMLETSKEIGKLYACHTCDNRKCVRPDHIFLGTAQDNILDCVRKGRHDPSRKLSDADVSAVRAAYDPPNVTMKMLGDQFGVSPDLIKQVVSGRMRGPSTAVWKKQSWKLTPEIIAQMRQRREAGVSYRQIGREFGVTHLNAANAIKGLTHAR